MSAPRRTVDVPLGLGGFEPVAVYVWTADELPSADDEVSLICELPVAWPAMAFVMDSQFPAWVGAMQCTTEGARGDADRSAPEWAPKLERGRQPR